MYWQGDKHDHIIYQSRATSLVLDDTIVDFDLSVLRARRLGLFAFYWLSVGQMSRAWTMIGAALRYAYGTGLHLCIEDPPTPAVGQDSLACTWWSLYTLEQTLSTITGRPSMTIDSVHSVPFPMSAMEEQTSTVTEPDYQACKGGMCLISPNQGWPYSNIGPVYVGTVARSMEADCGLYLKATAGLSTITRSILITLYSTTSAVKSAGETQQDMIRLGQRLDQWVLSLPQKLGLCGSIRGSIRLTRERVLISFHAYSARILLTRPCIRTCGTSREEGLEPSFAERMANSCIEAAQMIVDLLPDEPSSDFIYTMGPWWCVVHHLMQAVAVLLLGLSYACVRSQKGPMLIRCVRKVGLHLRASRNPVSQRGCDVIDKMTELLTRRWSLDVAEDWQPARRPLSIQELVS
ncbi:hypothetical protein M3J09_004695 [Ascochyta lentis]